VQWVGQAYLLVLVALLTAVGSYADMMGRKLLYTYGFLVFVGGSALCGVAHDLPELVGFRAIQGLGAAMLQANSVAIIVAAIPRPKLGKALGIQGAAQALGLALGPAVGGLLIGIGGWRLIFYVNVPVGLIGAVLSWFFVPRSRDLASRQPFDWIGLAIFVPATTCLLLAVSYGSRFGWGSPLIVLLFVAAAAMSGAFGWRERQTPAPMLDLALLSRGSFAAGVVSALFSFIVLFGTLTVVPFLLEVGRGDSTGAAGAQLLILPLALGVVAPFAGRAADRSGGRALMAAGLAVAAAALMSSTFSWADGRVAFLIALAAAGAGLGAFVSPNNAILMRAVPRHQVGMASGALNMTRGLGTALGLATAGLAYTLGAGVHVAASAAAATHGYHLAARYLAVVAAAAAVIAGLRATGGSAARKRPGGQPFTLE
jgi:EmrB/QacA subfamily drug resistance transporter